MQLPQSPPLMRSYARRRRVGDLMLSLGELIVRAHCPAVLPREMAMPAPYALLCFKRQPYKVPLDIHEPDAIERVLLIDHFLEAGSSHQFAQNIKIFGLVFARLNIEAHRPCD